MEPGEAEIVRLIYAKYLEPEMQLATVVRWLNDHGYRRISKGSSCPFNRDFAAGVLDNPINEVQPDGSTNMLAYVHICGKVFEVFGDKLGFPRK